MNINNTYQPKEFSIRTDFQKGQGFIPVSIFDIFEQWRIEDDSRFNAKHTQLQCLAAITIESVADNISFLNQQYGSKLALVKRRKNILVEEGKYPMCDIFTQLSDSYFIHGQKSDEWSFHERDLMDKFKIMIKMFFNVEEIPYAELLTLDYTKLFNPNKILPHGIIRTIKSKKYGKYAGQSKLMRMVFKRVIAKPGVESTFPTWRQLLPHLLDNSSFRYEKVKIVSTVLSSSLFSQEDMIKITNYLNNRINTKRQKKFGKQVNEKGFEQKYKKSYQINDYSIKDENENRKIIRDEFVKNVYEDQRFRINILNSTTVFKGQQIITNDQFRILNIEKKEFTYQELKRFIDNIIQQK